MNLNFLNKTAGQKWRREPGRGGMGICGFKWGLGWGVRPSDAALTGRGAPHTLHCVVISPAKDQKRLINITRNYRF